MKRLVAAALLVVFALAPSLARAGTIDRAPPAAVAEAARESPPSPRPAHAAPGSGGDYAAREAAAPQLGEFKGGSVVVFIGGGTLLIVVIIVLVVLIV